MSTQPTNLLVVKKLKSILHVIVGEEGVYEPNDTEIAEIANIFHPKLKDFGAESVVVTRTGVDIALSATDVLEVSIGSDTWSPTPDEAIEVSRIFSECARLDTSISSVAVTYNFVETAQPANQLSLGV